MTIEWKIQCIYTQRQITYNAEKVSDQPITNSQGNAMHAASAPSLDVHPSSIDIGIIAEPISSVPDEIKYKNIGWEARTT
jgi:hypothetical protein